MNYLRILPFFIIILLYCFTNSLMAGLGSGNNNYTFFNKSSDGSTGEFLPNVIVVKFAPEVKLAKKVAQTGLVDVDKLMQGHQAHGMRRMIASDKHLQKSKYLTNVYFIEYSGDKSPELVAKDFSQVANIVYAEPLRKHHINATPNDAMYIVQEGYYKKIKAPEAWDEVKGEQGNVVIAIVDGGTLISHPDLAANLWVNQDEIPSNGIDDEGNGFIDDIHGWNFANDSADPTGLASTSANGDHGTHVAGIASAVSNNTKGAAGASWNAKIMTINAGCPDEDNCIAYGFSGIQYAAFNGADIINCSWGSLSNYSQFEQDVINEATAQGAVVVCASGNDNTSVPHYPSAYANAFSVAATTITDKKANFSNFGPTIDVAAPGISIYSTEDSTNATPDSYNYSQGTSMSAPLVAGIIALVKTKNPSWLNIQAAEQVRVTSDAIDDDLIRSRINASRALAESLPSIRITNVTYNDSGGDGIINAGETVDVYLTLFNYLIPATSVNLTLTGDSQHITMQTGNLNLSTIGSMQEVTLDVPFSFEVDAQAPPGLKVTFELELGTAEYSDVDYFVLPIRPNYGTIDVNNIAVTVTNIGRIGYADSDALVDGIGFIYQGDRNLLFEGALIMGTSQNQISNAARGILVNQILTFDVDFTASGDGDLKIVTPGLESDQESKGIFEDTQSNTPMNLHIIQETFALTHSGFDDFVIFKYKIKNLGPNTLSNFYFGMFFDWDIPPVITNIADYDASRRMGYAYDTEQQVPTYVGVSALSEGGVSYRAIFNNEDPASGNPSWGIYDGFTDQEKWESISGGTGHDYLTAGAEDISFVISQGPFDIAPQATQALGFAMIAAPDYAQVLVHADSAQSFWDRVVVLDIEEDNREFFPERFALSQNYPNPFNPTTKIKFDVEKIGRVKIDIFNTLGQKVRTLFDNIKAAGQYEIEWDGINDLGQSVASGVYIYKMTAGDFAQTRKMLLLR